MFRSLVASTLLSIAAGASGAMFGCAASPPCPCAAPAPPKAVATCTSAQAPVATEPPAAPELTCGQLALREARLVAADKGDLHPALVDVRGRLAQCEDRRPSAADCLAVRKAGIELARDYGPKHPERIMNAAEQALCDQASQP